MEDYDAMYESDLEGDFINLLKQDFSKDLFIRNASIMFGGDDWIEQGREIVKDVAPELLKKFDTYAAK
jgi:hypothetical protein